MMTFSVVIPTLRRQRMLREALSSVQGQTLRDFEVLVVDDEPSRMTERMIQSMKDERVHYLVNDRRPGGSGARNVGILKAKGEWVAFLDDDDVWLDTRLERMRDLSNEVTPATTLLYSGWLLYDFNKRFIRHRIDPELRGKLSKQQRLDSFLGSMSNAVVRRSAFDTVGLMDEDFASQQDIELYWRLTEVGEVDFVDEPLLMVRIGEHRRITRTPEAMRLGRARLKAKHPEMFTRG